MILYRNLFLFCRLVRYYAGKVWGRVCSSHTLRDGWMCVFQTVWSYVNLSKMNGRRRSRYNNVILTSRGDMIAATFKGAEECSFPRAHLQLGWWWQHHILYTREGEDLQKERSCARNVWFPRTSCLTKWSAGRSFFLMSGRSIQYYRTYYNWHQKGN